MADKHTQSVLPGSDAVGPASEIWGSDAWRRSAMRWVDEVFAAHGMQRVPTTPAQPRLRPWSTLLVVDTEKHGRFWFKAAVPELAPETQIVTWLGKVAPGSIPVPLAVDHDRHWTLTPDLGRSMRDAGDGTDLSKLSALMRLYARVQRGSIAVLPDLRDAGVATMGPQDVARELLGMRIAPEVAHGVRAAAGRLDSLGLPLTIHHGDLHPGNIFITNPAPASFGAILSDWNDASIGNPLCSLLAPIRYIQSEIGGVEGERAAQRLTRAYLSCWSDLASSHALKTAMNDALIIAKSNELVTWRKALARATRAEQIQWGQHGARSLAEVTQALGLSR